MGFFFKPLLDISHISQNGFKKLFTIINGNFDGSKIDYVDSILSFFNVIFFFKEFTDISHISSKCFKEIIYNKKMPTNTELMEILKVNEIRGYFHYTKSKLIELLIKRGLILKNMKLINK